MLLLAQTFGMHPFSFWDSAAQWYISSKFFLREGIGLRLYLCFVLLLTAGCSTFTRKEAVNAPLHKTIKAVSTAGRKLNYDLQSRTRDGVTRIRLSKYGGGKLVVLIYFKDETTRLKVRSYGSGARTVKAYNIFMQAFAQEISGKRFAKEAYVKRKSYFALHSLNLLNSGFALFYAGSGNPYINTDTKWVFSLLYTFMDGYCIHEVVRGDRPYGALIVLSLLKFAAGFDGSFWVRNYNDIVDSGYNFRMLDSEKPVRGKSLLVPLFVKKF